MFLLLVLSLRAIFLLLVAGVISVLFVMASGVGGSRQTGVSHLIEHLRGVDERDARPARMSAGRTSDTSRQRHAA